MNKYEIGPRNNWPPEQDKPITIPPKVIVIYESPWDFNPTIVPIKEDGAIVQ